MLTASDEWKKLVVGIVYLCGKDTNSAISDCVNYGSNISNHQSSNGHLPDVNTVEVSSVLNVDWRSESLGSTDFNHEIRHGTLGDPHCETAHSGCCFGGNGSEYEVRNAERAKALKEEIGNAPIVETENKTVYRFVKRVFDIVFSATVLVFFSWLFLLIAIIVKLDDPKGPVFFKQERVGKDGSRIIIHKFRSMCIDAEERLEELYELNEKTGPAFKIAKDPRLTRSGKWLRKLSFDELPQFWDTLRGDLSIVGPRPALPSEVAQYNDYQRQRLLVKPGITCYWQTRINRDSISFDEWVNLDLLYIKKCGLWVDFKLVIQTIGIVLMAQGN